jgi:hypothetical protein
LYSISRNQLDKIRDKDKAATETPMITPILDFRKAVKANKSTIVKNNLLCKHKALRQTME